MLAAFDSPLPILFSTCWLFCAGCDGEREGISREILESLPSVSPSPSDSPLTVEKMELGRLLFWDPILSGHQDVACATCHHPDFGYGDALALSIGVGGVGLGPARVQDPEIPLVPRNAPTVLNTGFNGWVDGEPPPDPATAPMFWDSRERSLEAQALGPIRSGVEMRGDAYPEEAAIERVLLRLAENPEYVQLFAEAFGQDPCVAVNEVNLGRAIAAFERHLSRPSSAYDRWLAGNEHALDVRQLRGLDALFRVGCIDCHSGPMFSDYELHRIGAPDQPGVEDVGDGSGSFRTPSLRNVALTAPYMHSGSIASLDDVMEFYDHPAGRDLDPLLDGVEVSDADGRDIAAFLRALTDDFDRTIPSRVPSGLPPGGAIEE